MIVGRFRNSDGNQSGFVQNGDTITQVDYPDETAVNTFLYGINDKGIATGYWDNGAPDNIDRGFIYDTNTGEFQAVHVPGENAFTVLEGINSTGWFAVRSDAGNFIYCLLKNNCPGGRDAGPGAGSSRCTRSDEFFAWPSVDERHAGRGPVEGHAVVLERRAAVALLAAAVALGAARARARERPAGRGNAQPALARVRQGARRAVGELAAAVERGRLAAVRRERDG